MLQCVCVSETYLLDAILVMRYVIVLPLKPSFQIAVLVLTWQSVALHTQAHQSGTLSQVPFATVSGGLGCIAAGHCSC